MNNLLKRWALLSGLMALVVLSSNIVSAQTVIIDDSFGFDQDVVYYGPIRDSQMNPYGGSSFVSHAITGGDITYTVHEGVVLVRTAADGALQIFGGDNFRPATWKKADFYTVINSTPGHAYTVSFDVLQWANEGGHKINGSAIDGAGVGGTLLGSSGDVGSNTTGQISFTASSNTTTIRLRGIIGYRNDKSDIGIGRLQVTDLTPATPPPAPVSLVFDDFSDLSGFSLHGSATGVGGQLRLTGAFEAQAGSAFLSNPISLAGDAAFSAAFSFQMTNPGGQAIYGPTGPHDEDGPGADGLAFVVASAPAVGASGQGIGYQGIPNSIGVEFDTWNNSPNHPYYPTPSDIYGDDDGNHIAVNINGDISSPIGYTQVSPRLNNGGLWYAWVDYNGQTTILEVRLSQSSQRPTAPTITVSRDLALALGDNVYIGFTSATGAAWENHDIVGLQFNNTYDPVIDVPGPTNSAPVANAGTYGPIECAGPTGTTVTLDGSGSSDADGNTLTYSWREGGNEIATGATAEVTLTKGSHTIELVVNDGTVDSAPAVAEISVVDTTPPVITLNGEATISIICGVAYEDSGATATDLCDGDLTSEIRVGGSVDVNVPGTYTLAYKVKDSSGNISEVITRTVEVINPRPEWALISPVILDENSTLDVTVSATIAGGKGIVLSAPLLPSVATFSDNGSGSGTVSLAPTFDDAGSYKVVVAAANADDPSLYVKQTFVITVNDVNRLPELVAGDQSVDEGQVLEVIISATDPDGDRVRLTVDDLTVSPLSEFAAFVDNGDGTGTLTLTPDFTHSGVYSGIVVTATELKKATSPKKQAAEAAKDPKQAAAAPAAPATPVSAHSGSVSETITITVNNVNRAPSLVDPGPATKPGNQSLDEGQTLLVALSATDPDGNVPTLSTANLPDFATFTDNEDGTASLSFAPDFDAAGAYADITVTASDGELNDSVIFALQVNNVNRAPVAVAQNVEVNLSAAGEATLSAEAVNDGSSDPDGDEITLSLSQETFSCEDLGEVTVTLTVSDGELSSTADAVVTVKDVTPPTVESISEPIVIECTNSVNDSVSLFVVASDMCDPELDYKWFDEFDNLLGGTSSLTVAFDMGEHWARVVITDDSGNATEEIVSVIIQDTTPAEITAGLTPVNKPKSGKDSKSKKSSKSNKSVNSNLYFAVGAQALDVCDENPVVTAFITQPLTASDVYEVKYKQDDKKVEIDIKIQESKIKVDLRGPDESVLLSMLDVALAQGGFSVTDGQELTIKSKELQESKSSKSKKSEKSKKSKKEDDPRKGSYKYEFDLNYTLEEVDGVAVRLVVSAVDASGNESDPVIVAPPARRSSKVALTKPVLGEEEVASDYAFGLDQNHPNPFNPSTTIRYSLGEASDVRLIVYNVLGQQVRELTNAFQGAGQYEVVWNGQDALGRDVSSGLYLYRLQAGSNIVVRKMLFTK